MIGNFLNETLEHFQITPEQQKHMIEQVLLFKRIEYYDLKLKNGPEYRKNKKAYCESCDIMIYNINKHYQSKKHRKKTDTSSLIEQTDQIE